jgi:predicted TIM-barrel enzyme
MTTTSEVTAVSAARTARMVAVPRQAAEEAGLAARVLVDIVVWDDCVTWTRADTARKGIMLDEAARLADVLYLAACALKRDSAEDNGTGRPVALPFTVERVPRATAGREAEKVTLLVTAGRGARGTVTVTITPAPVGDR